MPTPITCEKQKRRQRCCPAAVSKHVRTTYEDGAAEAHAEDGRLNGRFDAGALEGDEETAGEACLLLDLLTEALGIDAALHEYRLDAGHELLCEIEARLSDVGDDDGGCPCGASGEERDETDGTSATDEKGVAQLELGAFDTGEGHSERLEKGALLEADAVGDLVDPGGGVEVEASESAVVRGRREKDNLGAGIVATNPAELALATGYTSLHGYSVSYLETLHTRTDLMNLSSTCETASGSASASTPSDSVSITGVCTDSTHFHAQHRTRHELPWYRRFDRALWSGALAQPFSRPTLSRLTFQK